jgi:hypothetical protein
VGLARYCRGLIEAIGRVDHENRYEILMPCESYRFPERPNLRYRVIRFPVFKRRFWEQVAPLLVGPYDLLHFPYDSGIAWKYCCVPLKIWTGRISQRGVHDAQ